MIDFQAGLSLRVFEGLAQMLFAGKCLKATSSQMAGSRDKDQ